MAKGLKVYGWQGWRRECPPGLNGGRQTREIVAARSKAEAARLSGNKGPWQMFNLSETVNDIEVEIAMSDPGTVFWAPTTHYGREYTSAARPTEPSGNNAAPYEASQLDITQKEERTNE